MHPPPVDMKSLERQLITRRSSFCLPVNSNLGGHKLSILSCPEMMPSRKVATAMVSETCTEELQLRRRQSGMSLSSAKTVKVMGLESVASWV